MRAGEDASRDPPPTRCKTIVQAVKHRLRLVDRSHIEGAGYSMIGLLISAAMAAGPADQPTSSLSGAWTVSDSLPKFGVTFALECSLSQTGVSVVGSCSGKQGKAAIVKGSASQGRLTFAYRTEFAGVPCRFVYVGKLAPDGGLEGSLSAGELSGTFAATRH
jgi:hypothetical protein